MKADEKCQMQKVRVAVIGDRNVGKSALTVRYLTRRYIGEYRSNTDLLYRQMLTVNGSPVNVEIVDICLASHDSNLFPEEAVQWADVCVIVYDVTARNSFRHAKQLLDGVQQVRSHLPLALLGNKSDLEHLREVDHEEGRTLAVKSGCQFHEVSVAENSPEIYTAFDSLLDECRLSMLSRGNTLKIRKFSVSKMIGSLVGNNNSSSNNNSNSHAKSGGGNHGGTVVVCKKSDLYKARVLKRRQNFNASASL